MELEPTYTAYEAAAALRVSYSTLIRMVHKRALRATKVGRAWRVRETELRRVLGLDWSEGDESHDEV